MYSVDEINNIQHFLKRTPESHLRNMLIEGAFSDVHFKVLMKLARGCSEDEFVEIFSQESFGKLRLTGPELDIKEKFWSACRDKMVALGLLSGKVKAA